MELVNYEMECRRLGVAPASGQKPKRLRYSGALRGPVGTCGAERPHAFGRVPFTFDSTEKLSPTKAVGMTHFRVSPSLCFLSTSPEAIGANHQVTASACCIGQSHLHGDKIILTRPRCFEHLILRPKEASACLDFHFTSRSREK